MRKRRFTITHRIAWAPLRKDALQIHRTSIRKVRQIDIRALGNRKLAETRHTFNPHPVSAFPVDLVRLDISRNEETPFVVDLRRELKGAYDLFNEFEWHRCVGRPSAFCFTSIATEGADDWQLIPTRLRPRIRVHRRTREYLGYVIAPQIPIRVEPYTDYARTGIPSRFRY